MITVLDFEKGEVHTYNVEPNFDWSRIVDFLAEQGHNVSNCQYMSSIDEHDLIFHS